MKENYPFLKDELTLLEIRKHKWIESEKQGREVGFATAALDWVKRYGQLWIQFRKQLTEEQNIFSEKRKLRRFNYKFPVELMASNSSFNCHTDNISLIGVSCTVEKYIPSNTTAQVTIRFPSKNISPIKFESRILRVSKPKNEVKDISYNIFLPFNEKVRDYIRLNTRFFSN